MVDLKPVKSSNVESVGYEPGDGTKGTLHVRFRGGAVYAYADVPQKHYDDLIAAKSVGSHLHANVRGKFKSTKLEPETKA